MSSVSQQRPPGGAADKRRDPGASLTRYRVMALVTGCMLLLLTIVFVVQLSGVGPAVLGRGLHHAGPVGRVIYTAHGWIYVVYLVTVADLWSKLRWPSGRLLVLVLCGVVPFLSFWAERRVVAEVRAGRSGPDVPLAPPSATTSTRAVEGAPQPGAPTGRALPGGER